MIRVKSCPFTMPPKTDAKAIADAVVKALATDRASQPQSSKSGGKKKKKNKPGRSGGTASIKFSRTELVASVTLAGSGSFKASGTIKVTPDSAPILKKLGGAFERARWERSNFYWKPMVGAMYSGSIAMGVDWDLRSPATSRADVAAYAPSQVMPLREDGENKPLRLDPSKLKGRNWYNYGDSQPAIACPAQLVWVAEGESAVGVGEIYWTYTVILDGPHA